MNTIFVIDISYNSIKGLLLQKNWNDTYEVYYKYKMKHKIFIGKEIDFENFKEILQKFIYNTEYDIGEKITNIHILFDVFNINFQFNSKSIFINNQIINIQHIKNLESYLNNEINIINKKIIWKNNSFFCNDTLVKNPLNLTTNTLKLLSFSAYISKEIFDNINLIIKNLKLEINYFKFNLSVIEEYLSTFINIFIIIHVNMYDTYVLLVENNKIIEIHKITLGLQYLLQSVAKETQNTNNVYNIIKYVGVVYSLKNEKIYKINVNFIETIWREAFNSINSDIKNKFDVPIFINGLTILEPLSYFLTFKTKKNITTLTNFLKTDEEYECLYAYLNILNTKNEKNPI